MYKYKWMNTDTNTDFFFSVRIYNKKAIVPLGRGPRLDRGHFSIFIFCTI